MQIALVVDQDDRLLGTVTDGDIRRGILRGVPLEASVCEIMNTKPRSVTPSDDRAALLLLMRQAKIHHLPVLDERGRVVSLELLDSLIQVPELPNEVVLMAGGQGVRLKPLTDECPKPMLHVGGQPLLETVLSSIIEHGFHKFYISVNHKAEVITNHFGDGCRWGVDIEYLHERRKLGTAGALSLLPRRPTSPILVINGDVLTSINLRNLLDYHANQGAKATMCVREIEFQVPYGVIDFKGEELLSIVEKPNHRFFVNAGIYVLDPSVIDVIPPDTYMDMTAVFTTLLEQKQPVVVFPIREYWVDVGQNADFERANKEFDLAFKRG
jgi:NDP-sugar pyrophosphorylase family protein